MKSPIIQACLVEQIYEYMSKIQRYESQVIGLDILRVKILYKISNSTCLLETLTPIK